MRRILGTASLSGRAARAPTRRSRPAGSVRTSPSSPSSAATPSPTWRGRSGPSRRQAGRHRDARQLHGRGLHLRRGRDRHNAIIVTPGAAVLISVPTSRPMPGAPQERRSLRHAARTADRRGPEGADPRHSGRRHHHPQPGAGRDLPDAIYPLCDYITPNETEVEGTDRHQAVSSTAEDARLAADALSVARREGRSS